MRKLILAILVLSGLIGCKEVIIEPMNQEIKLVLIDLRETLAANYSFKDIVTKKDSLVCITKYPAGYSEIYIGNSYLKSFTWKAAMYCGGINPTRLQVAEFSPYSLILMENGDVGVEKTLYICKDNKFYSGLSLNTISIKDFVYTGKTLKFTCNDGWIRTGAKPDYYIEVEL